MVDMDAQVANLMSRVEQGGLSTREGRLKISARFHVILHRLGKDQGERGKGCILPHSVKALTEESRALLRYIAEDSGDTRMSKVT